MVNQWNAQVLFELIKENPLDELGKMAEVWIESVGTPCAAAVLENRRRRRRGAADGSRQPGNMPVVSVYIDKPASGRPQQPRRYSSIIVSI